MVDEAHKLPDAARQMYTETLSESDMNDLCLQLQQAHYPEMRHEKVKLRKDRNKILKNHDMNSYVSFGKRDSLKWQRVRFLKSLWGRFSL